MRNRVVAGQFFLGAIILPIVLCLTPDWTFHAAFGAVAPMPRVLWSLEAPGYQGGSLGPSGGQAVALVFSDQRASTLSLRAVDIDTGTVRWANNRLGRHDVDDAGADGDRLYTFSGGAGRLTARAWNTGRPLWTAPASGGLLAQNGRVVWISGPGQMASADGQTGRILWDRAFPANDNWTPGTLASGDIYVMARGNSNEFGCSGVALALDGQTGATRRQTVFDPRMGCQYVFSYLRWSPRIQGFYAQDGLEGAGIHGRAVFVLGQDLTPRWSRSDIRNCRAIEDMLVCEAYARLPTGAWVQHGPIAVAAATGRTLWQVRLSDTDLGVEDVVGEWHGAVIVIRRPIYGSTGSLRALRPSDGETVWTLAVPARDAGIYGDVLLAALGAEGQPARVVAYEAP